MKKKKNSTRRSLTKKLTNFHNVQNFPPFSTTILQIFRPLEDHHQQKMVKTHPTAHFFSNLPLHFESTHHLSLGFLHPLRFFNSDHFNHFRRAYNTICFKLPNSPESL
jgi:hypothetical protein